MTCFKSQQLLEAYLDRELSSEAELKLRNHLDSCEICQKEHSNLISLKELLNNSKSEFPTQPYWEDTKNIILAKTVDKSEPVLKPKTISLRNPEQKAALHRSLISVAASFVILMISIFIGSSHDKDLPTPTFGIDQMFTTYEVDEQLRNYSNYYHKSPTEQLSQIKNMIYTGPIGMPGRVLTINSNLNNGNSDY